MSSENRFLCGCDPDSEFIRGYTLNVVSNGMNTTVSNKRYDSENYEVCPWHGERLFGWRGPRPARPKQPNTPPLDLHKFEHTPDLRDNRDPQQVGLEHLANRNGSSNGNH